MRTNTINMLAKATNKSGNDWNKTFMMMSKTEEGTVTLADRPAETHNCSLEGRAKDGKKHKEGKWEIEWPITIKGGDKIIEETYWVRVESTEINGKTMNTSFTGFTPKAARICSQENLGSSIKNRKSQANFGNLLKKLEAAKQKKEPKIEGLHSKKKLLK